MPSDLACLLVAVELFEIGILSATLTPRHQPLTPGAAEGQGTSERVRSALLQNQANSKGSARPQPASHLPAEAPASLAPRLGPLGAEVPRTSGGESRRRQSPAPPLEEGVCPGRPLPLAGPVAGQRALPSDWLRRVRRAEPAAGFALGRSSCSREEAVAALGDAGAKAVAAEDAGRLDAVSVCVCWRGGCTPPDRARARARGRGGPRPPLEGPPINETGNAKFRVASPPPPPSSSSGFPRSPLTLPLLHSFHPGVGDPSRAKALGSLLRPHAP